MIGNLVKYLQELSKRSDQRAEARRLKRIDDYLSQSVDRYDLERRERHLDQQGFLR